jgi:hypothetical protein
MARDIWSGEGELQHGQAYWMISRGWRTGVLVGRKEVRRRVVSYVSRMFSNKTREVRAEIVRQTVDNDEWLSTRNGCTIDSICRDAWDHYYTYGFDIQAPEHLKGK